MTKRLKAKDRLPSEMFTYFAWCKYDYRNFKKSVIKRVGRKTINNEDGN